MIPDQSGSLSPPVSAVTYRYAPSLSVGTWALPSLKVTFVASGPSSPNASRRASASGQRGSFDRSPGSRQARTVVSPLALLMLRIALEERFLRRELAGYSEYTSRVRYRLLPGIW